MTTPIKGSQPPIIPTESGNPPSAGGAILQIVQVALSFFTIQTQQPTQQTLAKTWISRPGGPDDPDPLPGEPIGPYPIGHALHDGPYPHIPNDGSIIT